MPEDLKKIKFMSNNSSTKTILEEEILSFITISKRLLLGEEKV